MQENTGRQIKAICGGGEKEKRTFRGSVQNLSLSPFLPGDT